MYVFSFNRWYTKIPVWEMENVSFSLCCFKTVKISQKLYQHSHQNTFLHCFFFVSPCFYQKQCFSVVVSSVLFNDLLLYLFFCYPVHILCETFCLSYLYFTFFPEISFSVSSLSLFWLTISLFCGTLLR